MKPAPFEYHAPTEIEEALALLQEHSFDECRILAGGQTLVPMMALRLAFPEHLVDINRIESLRTIEEKEGELHIGALVRHDDFARPATANPLGDLLSKVQRHIAHYPIRKRGTMCGSLANADPASEWCLAAVTLGAEMEIRSAAEQRFVPAEEFFFGIMTTAIQPEEMLVSVRLPLLKPGTTFGFYEFSRRAGDFGMVICLAILRLEDGVVAEARIGLGGVEVHPRRIAEAEATLIGKLCDASAIDRAAKAASKEIEPLEDPDVPQDYRRHLVEVAVRHALIEAAGVSLIQGDL